jgi:hypothetical protein
MKLHKPRSKPISKGIDVIYYDGCQKKKTHKVHMNEIQNKDLKKMFIRHNFLKNKKKTISKRLLKIRFNFDPSKVHNYHLLRF